MAGALADAVVDNIVAAAAMMIRVIAFLLVELGKGLLTRTRAPLRRCAVRRAATWYAAWCGSVRAPFPNRCRSSVRLDAAESARRRGPRPCGRSPFRARRC